MVTDPASRVTSAAGSKVSNNLARSMPSGLVKTRAGNGQQTHLEERQTTEQGTNTYSVPTMLTNYGQSELAPKPQMMLRANELAQNFKHTNQMIDHILASGGFASSTTAFEPHDNKPVSIFLLRGTAKKRQDTTSFERFRSSLGSKQQQRAANLRASLNRNIIEINKKSMHNAKQKRERLDKRLESEKMYQQIQNSK